VLCVGRAPPRASAEAELTAGFSTTEPRSGDRCEASEESALEGLGMVTTFVVDGDMGVHASYAPPLWISNAIRSPY